MPSPNKSSINPSTDAVYRSDDEQLAPNENSGSEMHSLAQLARLADLIACGELPLPDDLLPDQREYFAREVRKRRRRRLVEFIARAIAMDIHRSRKT